MIVLDSDILVKLGGADADPEVISHLRQYSHEEWTIPSIVAFGFYRSCGDRTEIERARRVLNRHLDRVLDFSDEVAVEAAYLDGKLREQGVTLPPADLLNLATAYEADGTFVTHNKNDFDEPPLLELADVDIVHTT